MMDLLSKLDARTAAGVLADAAMHLEGRDQAASNPLIANQRQVEAAVVSELRQNLKLSEDDFSPYALEILTNALDEHAEYLLKPVSLTVTNRDLGKAGVLPSDVYNINFISNLPEDFGYRWDIEKIIAEDTVKNPHKEEHISGLPSDPSAALVSIFAKYFWHKYPAKGFWLLVIGGRDGINLNVHQVWRLYLNEVDLSHCETLLDSVREFAETFGSEIELNGRKSKFFLSARRDAVVSAFHKVRFQVKPGQTMTMTIFSQGSDYGEFAHMVIPINLTVYFEAVSKWRGWSKDFLSQLMNEKASILNSRRNLIEG